MSKHTISEEFKRIQKLVGLINEEVSPEINDLIQRGLQMQKDIELQNQNKPPQETNWEELDWDFSEEDSVNFGDFEVDIDQFKKGIKNGYIIDNNGNKRSIYKNMIKSILQSYKENL